MAKLSHRIKSPYFKPRVETYSSMLHDYLGKYDDMVRRYPRAAKKKRVRSKWRHLYGVSMKEEISKPGKFFYGVDMGEPWKCPEIIVSLKVPDDL